MKAFEAMTEEEKRVYYEAWQGRKDKNQELIELLLSDREAGIEKMGEWLGELEVKVEEACNEDDEEKVEEAEGVIEDFVQDIVEGILNRWEESKL